ncbi:MAG: DNA cytosine methyltransferase, partial [Planctomycetota bacterium]
LSSRQGRDFKAAVEELAGLGYWLDAFLIDAQWFVPQSRRRLFLVGYRHDLLQPPLVLRLPDADPFDDPWQSAVHRADLLRPRKLLDAIDAVELSTGWATIDAGNPVRTILSLGEFIDVDPDQAWWDADETDRHLEMMFDRHLARIRSFSANSVESVVFTGFRRVRDGKQRLEVRFDGVAGCLRTPRGGSAKQVVLVVNRQQIRMRWMTPREYARLQGAGDYTLPSNTIEGLFGFGDAVCVPVIRWIDRNMLTPVYESFAGVAESAASAPTGHARSILNG